MASAEPLIVETIYMYEKENAENHHTFNFELIHVDEPTPILRRGQEFNLAIRFNREYVEETDIVRLLFNFGDAPSVLKGTQGIDQVTSRDYLSNLEAWGIRMIGVNETDLSIEVRSPIDSPIGIWQLNVETTVAGSREPPNTYHYEKNIYLLFNPWLKDDFVYMEDERLLDEYVLNDVGKIWVGPHGSARGREWIFGQFDASVLPAAMLMFEKSTIKTILRGDPIKVSRTISKMANAYNPTKDGGYEYNGILEGRWEPPYDDGSTPSSWTGSVPILEQYLESAGQPVKYGQCWVFAGVVATICRAIGLPCRVVTNVVSAHDANASLSLDVYYDAQMNRLGYDPTNPDNADSVWNYHVWNDVWMARPDLPKGYGGWQAVDGTPQELSDGIYRCGPAPVEAVRQGVTGFNYDIPFLIASVNADQISWIEDPNSLIGWSRISSNTNYVGKMILTKAPWIFDPNGDRDRKDITDEYKAPEGSTDERLTLWRAVRSTPSAKRFYDVGTPEKEDVVFELVDLDRVFIGEPFTVTVNIKNNSEETRTIKIVLSAGSVYYNGNKAQQVKRAEAVFSLGPAEGEILRLKSNVEEYLDKLVEYSNMKLYAIATVQETNQSWAAEDDFQIDKPSIRVEIQDSPVVGKPSTIVLSFQNPLKFLLTECVFNYAGPGLSKNKVIKFRNVRPLEDVRVEHQLVPQKAGQQKIVATFTSTQLVDITGALVVDVLDEE